MRYVNSKSCSVGRFTYDHWFEAKFDISPSQSKKLHGDINVSPDDKSSCLNVFLVP